MQLQWVKKEGIEASSLQLARVLTIKGTEQEEASQPILTGGEQRQESRKQEDNAPSKLPQGVGSMTTSA
ncbi:unnamed protein product [Bubo scandiacus]